MVIGKAFKKIHLIYLCLIGLTSIPFLTPPCHAIGDVGIVPRKGKRSNNANTAANLLTW
jgi:hypothetical protein